MRQDEDRGRKRRQARLKSVRSKDVAASVDTRSAGIRHLASRNIPASVQVIDRKAIHRTQVLLHCKGTSALESTVDLAK